MCLYLQHNQKPNQMKTNEVRVGGTYLYGDKIVVVVSRIKHPTNKVNMQSGVLFTGYKGRQKRFELSTGDIVKADKLMEIF